MEVTKRFMAFVAFLLLLLFGASARAQSDVRTPDQKVYFPQMDPVLTGMWLGRGDGDGVRFDPQAIACMMRACADIQATVPPAAREQCRGLNDDSCPYRQVRNGNNPLYQLCYAAHQARISQPGYKRLANPPSMTSLTCSVIAAQKESSDESIYTAVNGHSRPNPQATPPPAATGRNKRPRIALKPGEADQLMAELNRASGSLAPPVAGKPPVVRQRRSATASRPPTKPVGSPTTDAPHSGGLPGFRIVSQDDKETVLRVLPGAGYHTVEKSFLAKDHETDSLAVMAYEGNSRAQLFFPYHIKDKKIELYHPRMRWAANDAKRLQPLDAMTRAFIHECDNSGCETRFALQAGETLRIPRKSASPEGVSNTPDRPAAPPHSGTEGSIDGPPASAGALASAAPISTMPVELETIPISPSSSVNVESPGTAADDGVDIPFWAAIWTLGCGIVILAYHRYTKRGCKIPEVDDEAHLVGSAGFAIIAPPSSHIATFEKQTAASAPPAPQPVQPSATLPKTLHGLGPGGWSALPEPSSDSS